MAVTYTNFLSGTITDNPLLIGGTTVNGSALASMPAITGSDTMWLVLDPDGANGAPEIVSVTAHTAAATSATITRAQQSTTAREHPAGTVFRVAATKSDLDELPFRKLTTTGDIMYASAANVAARLAIGSNGLPLVSNGTTPAYAALAAGGLASDSVTTAKILDANVTTAKIADSNVTTAKIADSNVTTAKIADSNVTSAKIADGAVTNAKFDPTRCRLTHSGTATTTPTAIPSWTENEDTGGFYSSGAEAAIPTTGYYLVSLRLTPHASAVDWVRADLTVGGVDTVPQKEALVHSLALGAGDDGVLTTLRYLTATTTLGASLYNASAADNARAHTVELIALRLA